MTRISPIRVSRSIKSLSSAMNTSPSIPPSTTERPMSGRRRWRTKHVHSSKQCRKRRRRTRVKEVAPVLCPPTHTPCRTIPTRPPTSPALPVDMPRALALWPLSEQHLLHLGILGTNPRLLERIWTMPLSIKEGLMQQMSHRSTTCLVPKQPCIQKYMCERIYMLCHVLMPSGTSEKYCNAYVA